MKQKQVVEQHTIKIEERIREEKLKALDELLDENLKVDDHLANQGWDSYARILGLANDHTIFKFEVETEGDKELTKKESTVQYKKQLPSVKAVAIGPYHRQNLLRFNNDYKWKITRFMVKYYRLDTKKYFTEIEKEESFARSRYNIDLLAWKSEDFLTMLLLDSCFILFAMDAYCQSLLSKEFFLEHMALYADIREHSKWIKIDLLMVDNQIPFLTIELLLGCFPEDSFISREMSIKDLALLCFEDIWPTRNKEQKMDDENSFDHLLQLFHLSRRPVEGYEMDRRELGGKNASGQYIPSATELQKSVIKFEKKNSGSNLDITFTRGLMKISAVINIPTLYLYDYSDEIFRNLIAFEGSPTNEVLCFTAYSACMSCLLQREDDVKLLRENGIIASTSYNDADVVQFFKDLYREVQDRLMPDTLLDLYGRVMEHHDNRVSKAYGGFKMQYCPNMWVGLSLVAAFILFILTLLQTIYSVK